MGSRDGFISWRLDPLRGLFRSGRYVVVPQVVSIVGQESPAEFLGAEHGSSSPPPAAS